MTNFNVTSNKLMSVELKTLTPPLSLLTFDPSDPLHATGCSMKRASSMGFLNVTDKAAGDHYQERNNRLRMSRDLSASHTDLVR